MSECPMPNRRETVRHKLTIGGTRVYLDVGLCASGQPGEIFLVVEQTGAERRWLYDEVARLASKLLQHGCAVEDIAEGWLGTKGAPCGPVQHHARVKNCTSILDCVARHLLIEYGGREDLAHVPKEVV